MSKFIPVSLQELHHNTDPRHTLWNNENLFPRRCSKWITSFFIALLSFFVQADKLHHWAENN